METFTEPKPLVENPRYARDRRAALAALDYVQLGSAAWFWERWVNSYALQVEPARFKTADEATIEGAEALHVRQTRDTFFAELRTLVARECQDSSPSAV